MITYFRSSSYNNWDFCPMQFFLTYVLGHVMPSGHKAEKGTIVHKILECLAAIKKQSIDSPEMNSYKDDTIGEVFYNPTDLMDPHWLDDNEISVINRTRVNKSTYKVSCKLKSGHVRFGKDLVEEIIPRVFDYYSQSNRSIHSWKGVDLKDCTNWTWMALDYNTGQFDPRRRNIIDVEPFFDIEIDRPWAKFDHILPTGEKISGNLRIKGTVDLITRVDDGILEIVDWKTGQRLDWAKGGIKTYDKLCHDPQLMMYYYAARHMYPEYDNIILTIFYIRDGGPFSVCFDDSHMNEMERLLEKRYLEICNSKKPPMFDRRQKHFKCNKICAFYKNNFSGDKENMCRKIDNELELYGLEDVVKKYTKSGFDVGNYNAPGE